MPKQRAKYSEDPAWADVEPLPQDDGGPNALATIAYSEEYRETMEYLRAVMAANEMSQRVLELTAHIIGLNPAHYTVWLYRSRVLFHLKSPLRPEIDWLNTIALKYIKNYQIWHHRQLIITELDSPEGETEFLAKMFEKDAKNYHVWSYRQWLVRKFGLWDQGEIEEVERLMMRDVRNNSAWNHRWFLVFGRFQKGAEEADDELVERELEFAKDAIRAAPQNESPWNYLRGLIRKSGRQFMQLVPFAEEFAGLDEGARVRSSHALDLLATAYAEEDARREDAYRALDLLANKYDPIRANYWIYRKSLLEQDGIGMQA